jgi:3-oxoadipate enol-lactonase
MPYLAVNETRLYYEDTGTGSETIVFSHGLLMDRTMFDAQAETLDDSYRCVRFDHRGQGRSDVAASGYDMDSLCLDAAALIRQLDCAPVHFAGLSMGGFVGLRLAVRHPELLRSLILMETSADPEPAGNRIRYRLMTAVGRRFGFRPLLGRLLPLMFGRSFLRDPRRQAQRERWRDALLAADRDGLLRAAEGVIGRDGVAGQLDRIRTPTLILVGDEDRTTPVVLSERMQAGIRGSRLVVIPGAGHSSTLEQPETVTAAMLDFLVAPDDRQRGGARP